MIEGIRPERKNPGPVPEVASVAEPLSEALAQEGVPESALGAFMSDSANRLAGFFAAVADESVDRPALHSLRRRARDQLVRASEPDPVDARLANIVVPQSWPDDDTKPVAVAVAGLWTRVSGEMLAASGERGLALTGELTLLEQLRQKLLPAEAALRFGRWHADPVAAYREEAADLLGSLPPIAERLTAGQLSVLRELELEYGLPLELVPPVATVRDTADMLWSSRDGFGYIPAVDFSHLRADAMGELHYLGDQLAEYGKGLVAEQRKGASASQRKIATLQQWVEDAQQARLGYREREDVLRRLYKLVPPEPAGPGG